MPQAISSVPNCRYACQETGVKSRFAQWREVYQGTMSVAQWIWSLNIERRHLTRDQIAAAIVAREDLVKREQDAAKQRMAEGQKAGALAGAEARWARTDASMTESSSRHKPLKTQDAAPRDSRGILGGRREAPFPRAVFRTLNNVLSDFHRARPT